MAHGARWLILALLTAGCAAAPATSPAAASADRYKVQSVVAAPSPSPDPDAWIHDPAYQTRVDGTVVAWARKEAEKLLAAPESLGSPVVLTPEHAVARVYWSSIGMYMRGTLTLNGVTRPAEVLVVFNMGRWQLRWVRLGATP